MGLAAYSVSSTTVSTLHVLTHLSHTTSLRGSHYYYSHFTEEETDIPEIDSLAQVSELWRSWADWRLSSDVLWQAFSELLEAICCSLSSDNFVPTWIIAYSLEGCHYLCLWLPSFHMGGNPLGAMGHVFCISDLVPCDVTRLAHYWCWKHCSSESNGRVSHRQAQWTVLGVHW